MIVYEAPGPADAAPLDAMAQQVWIETFGHGYGHRPISTGPTGRLRTDHAGLAICSSASSTSPATDMAAASRVS